MSQNRPLICPPTPEAIARAATLIRDGRLVAFPTETVYGLGADATNDRAVAAIFEAKGRPHFNPLIIHVADAGQAEETAVFDTRARKLASAFWPGALTLVLPRRPESAVSLLACAGLDTVALRVPNHDVALALLAEVKRPLAAPSANPSGTVSPTTAAHVAASMEGRVAMILDGGPCQIGIESTVLDLTGLDPCVLRPGGVPAAAIEAEIGPLGRPGTGDPAKPRSPGLALRHYAPSRPLRLEARGGPERRNEALLAFGPQPPAGYVRTLNLSAAGDVTEAAANLFAMLHELDREEIGGIAVMPIPDRGLGEAINDRLKRAAEPEAAAAAHEASVPCRAPQRRG